MIFDTTGIREGHSTLHQDTDLATVSDDLPPLLGKISCIATLERTSSTLFVHLRFNGAVEQQCARCLTQFRYPVAGELKLIFQEKEGMNGAANDDGAADYYFNSRFYKIDVSSSIYDEIMISLPLKPLCNIACAGIRSGSRKLSFGDREPQIDPRWDALRKLQSRQEQS